MVERNFYMNFLRLGQQLSDFFTCSDLKITDEKTDFRTVHVDAHCNDLSSLVNHVIQSRKRFGDYFVKVEIDGGKGFLKTGKDTGVKRQIIVGVSEDLPEKHSNIEQTWSLACDMKAANINCSLQTHSSNFWTCIIYMTSCRHIYTTSCRHIYTTSCRHIYTTSCRHIYTTSCRHIYTTSCRHIYTTSCRHIYMTSCRHIYTTSCRHI
nr:unnamed protein product [Hydra vulgaris]